MILMNFLFIYFLLNVFFYDTFSSFFSFLGNFLFFFCVYLPKASN